MSNEVGEKMFLLDLFDENQKRSLSDAEKKFLTRKLLWRLVLKEKASEKLKKSGLEHKFYVSKSGTLYKITFVSDNVVYKTMYTKHNAKYLEQYLKILGYKKIHTKEFMEQLENVLA